MTQLPAGQGVPTETPNAAFAFERDRKGLGTRIPYIYNYTEFSIV